MMWKETTAEKAQFIQKQLLVKDPRLVDLPKQESEVWNELFPFSWEDLQQGWSHLHAPNPPSTDQFSLFDSRFQNAYRPVLVERISPNLGPVLFMDTLHSNLGSFLAVFSDQGLHYLHFIDQEDLALSEAETHFSSYKLEQQALSDELKNALFDDKSPLHLFPSGTEFQRATWQLVSQIPSGEKRTYLEIAEQMGDRNASRAVGTAIGQNPIAFVIPCHRVIQRSGQLAGFRWGLERKNALLTVERIFCQRLQDVI